MSYVDERLLVDEEKHSNEGPQIHPELGYQVVPPNGTQPKRVIMEALQMAIFKKLEEAGSTYLGAKNEKGEPHGQGQITYIDGSSYSGTFFNGLKHGQGISMTKEGQYMGQFSHDMKDGVGTLILPNEDSLKGSWRNDKKDGDFEYISASQLTMTKRIYFNDVEINLADQNPNNYDDAYVNLTILILAIGLYGIYEWVKGSKADYIALIFAILFLIGYIGDAFNAKTYIYLTKVRSIEEIHSYIDQGKTKAPIIDWDIECYHGGSNGEKKHVTYKFNKSFTFYEWTDKTPDTSNLDFFKRYPFVRLTFGLQTEMTPPASHSYEIQENEFKESNKRDIYQEFTTKKRFDGFEEDMTMLTGPRSLLFTTGVYLIFTFLGLNWLYRIMFTQNTRRAKFDFNKLIIK